MSGLADLADAEVAPIYFLGRWGTKGQSKRLTDGLGEEKFSCMLGCYIRQGNIVLFSVSLIYERLMDGTWPSLLDQKCIARGVSGPCSLYFAVLMGKTFCPRAFSI